MITTALPQKPSVPISLTRSYFPPADIGVFQREAAEILLGSVSMGRWVERFQRMAAMAQGTRFALATNSCTSALEVALLACGVRPGDRVIVPVQTFIATGMAVHNIGAEPVFADIRRETLCLDPSELSRLADEKVKAVIHVHFGGLIPPDILRIREICDRHGWALIEDAAHAHGARLDGRAAGSFGAAACFSYYPTKVLTAGEGGMIVTDDERIAEICRSYQLRGQDVSLPGEQFARPYGRNIRMPELSALLGVLQYGRLGCFVRARRSVASVYDAMLADEPAIVRPFAPTECFHNYWLYTLILPPGVDREAIKVRCKQRWDIELGWSYFPPLHLMPVFRELYGTREGRLPVAEDLLARTLCLPMHPLIGEADAQRVAECFLHEYRR
ncbi:MAG TPA: DegT/DnrJ/EryC1/StrS family aminotransferase [Thermoguttaceae bacterium]|nr:DegT/DnrJ/EryC1/StrS family aminotransferase [Thermoguttaceae bacterium]